jgi:hypothetical protein
MVLGDGTQEPVNIYYWGKLDEITFLGRLYDLAKMPSTDGRFKNAEGDIWQHTVNNDDWSFGWIFEDSRFSLSDGDDEYLLNFLCEVFHPAVRDESEQWQVCLKEINGLLKQDGYEIYEKSKLSGRVVFDWRFCRTDDSVLIAQSESIKSFLDTEYVRSQIQLMTENIETAPHVAIGKAKELIETCSKAILDEQGISYQNGATVIQLMKLACGSIDLAPENEKGQEGARKVLSSLTTISQGISELRNLFGDGHGKSADFIHLPPRYARLAVGAAVVVGNFMLDTYKERNLRGILSTIEEKLAKAHERDDTDYLDDAVSLMHKYGLKNDEIYMMAHIYNILIDDYTPIDKDRLKQLAKHNCDAWLIFLALSMESKSKELFFELLGLSVNPANIDIGILKNVFESLLDETKIDIFKTDSNYIKLVEDLAGWDVYSVGIFESRMYSIQMYL